MSRVGYKHISDKQNEVWTWQAHTIDKYIQLKRTNQKKHSDLFNTFYEMNIHKNVYFDPLKNT